MSEQSGEQTLRELLAKINHPLLEVRSRSLRSVSLKLRGGLLAVESLMHEEAFLSHLLQWFNFPEWGSEQLPLGLIEMMAECEGAAVSLVEMGAVEFLSQLRLNCDPPIHPLIDSILEKLLRIPHSLLGSSQTGSDHHLPLVTLEGTDAKSQVTTESRDEGSISDIPPFSARHLSLTIPPTSSHRPRSLSSSNPPASSLPHGQTESLSGRPQCQDVHVPQHTTGVVTSSYITTSTSMTSCYITASTSVVGKPVSVSPPLAHVQPLLQPYQQYSEAGPPTGVLAASGGGTNGRTEERRGEGGRGRGEGGKDKGRLFPWLRLSVNDLHILKATESHIQTTDCFQDSCQFLEDVLFQDFPAEVFLQRPALLQVLFSLLEKDVVSDESLPRSSLCLCLSQLSKQLAHRINSLTAASADHYTINNIHVNVLTRQGLVSAAALTNQNQWRESHDLEQLTQDMLVHLWSSAMTLDYYCSTLLAVSVSHLSRSLSRGAVRGTNPGGSGSTASSITPCLQLVTSVVSVIEAVSRVREEGGGEGGGGGEREREEGMGVEHLCTALSHSLALWRHISNQCPPDHTSLSTHLQLVCRVSICVAQCLQRALAYSRSSKSPPSLAPVVRDMVMNGVVMLAVPRLHGKLCTILERVDLQSYQIFQRIEELFISFQRMSTYLKQWCDYEATPTSLASQPDLGLAAAALPGLWMFCNCKFIEKAVNHCMRILSDKARQEDWKGARSLLLRLLTHGSEQVQAAAYKQLKEVLITTHPPSFPVTLGVGFLEELCCRASLSSLPTISRRATAILHAAISVVMGSSSERHWMLKGFVQRLPFIEASMAGDDGLFAAFCGLLDSESISELVKLQSLLRIMFSSSTELRKYAFATLMKLQVTSPSLIPSHSPSLTTSPPPSSHPSHDILVVGKSIQSGTGERTGLERSDISRLLHIVKSSIMDDLLKRSALEQLALLMKDFSLHQPAIEEGIVVEVLEIFRDKLKLKPEQAGGQEEELDQQPRERSEGEEVMTVDPKGFLKPCVECLQLVVQTSSEVRGQLASDVTFLIDMFKASIVCAGDLEFLHASSVLLASLVFSSSAQWTTGSQYMMKLPEDLFGRLKFTFSVGSYKPENPHETPCLLPPSQISHLPFPHSLSLLYHSAMAGGVEEFLATSGKLLAGSGMDEDSGEEERGRIDDQRMVSSCDPPPLLAGDFTALRALYSRSALTECASRLQGAASHSDVTLWLTHMTLVGECCLYEVVTSHCDGDHIQRCSSNWNLTFERFLQVHPVTMPDRLLLSHLLHCLTKLLNSRCLHGASFLTWLIKHTAASESACLQTLRSLIESREDQEEGGRQLERELLFFYTALSAHLVSLSPSLMFTANDPPSKHSTGLGEMSLPLLQTLSLCLAQLSVHCHSSLPSLQSCLQCLTHLSALLCSVGISNKVLLEMCTRLVTVLKEIACSVLLGRGEMFASFIGRGVVRRASLALSLLSRGVASSRLPASWYCQCLTSDSSACGFSWLQYLTSDRDPQVRYAGYSMLASMCGEKGVVEKLMVDWAPGEHFGLWGACMRVAVDLTEWVLVRQQALLVLVSTSALCSKHLLWDHLLTCMDEELSLKGSAALQVFLNHYPLTQLLEASDPHVAAPVFQLLHNLTLSFPQLLLLKLEPVNKFGELLLRCCDPTLLSTAPPSSSTSQHHINALDVLRVLVVTGSKVMLDLVLTEGTTQQLCQLLTWGDQESASSLELCVAILRLMECGLERAPCELSLVVLSALLSQWTCFTGLLCHSLLHPLSTPSTPSLQTLSLSLLHSLLAHKLRPPQNFDHTSFDSTLLTSLLDSEPSRQTLHNSMEVSELGKKLPIETESRECLPSGGLMCSALLEVYEGSEVTLTRLKGCDPGAGLVSKVLCLLLASSQTAKQTALKGGLVDSSLELVKALHSQLLCTDSLQKSSNTQRKKEPAQVSRICERFNLIKSMMYRSTEVKLAAQRCGLVAVVSTVWSWCTVSAPLCRAVLDMLTVFTARNSKGQSALSSTTKGTESVLHRIVSHASHCLTSHRSCVAARMSSPLAEVLAAALSLLANCALSTECRRVLKKTAVLSHFTTLTLHPPRPPPTSSSAPRASVKEPLLWVRLLLNLTFSSDGQQMVVKLPGALEVLLDLYHRSDLVDQSLCLLALRNLCFYGPSKTLLVENENFLTVLTSGLESRELWTRAVTASAVWALAHNCAKIKRTLRHAEVLEKLDNLQSSLSLQLVAYQNTGDVLPIHHLYRTNLTNALRNLC